MTPLPKTWSFPGKSQEMCLCVQGLVKDERRQANKTGTTSTKPKP